MLEDRLVLDPALPDPPEPPEPPDPPSEEDFLVLGLEAVAGAAASFSFFLPAKL